MSKVTKSERITQLEQIAADQARAFKIMADRLKSIEVESKWIIHMTGIERPQLKQLDQSVFDGLDEKWRFAAVDECSEAYIYMSEPMAGTTYFVGGNGTDYRLFGQGYDASNWQNSLIERDIAKELSGSDFTRKMLADSTDMVNCYVSDDSDYDALNDKDERTIVGFSDGWFHTNSVASWKYAVPAPKEKELTGSELCRAMLARGDKYVMCLLSDMSHAGALSSSKPRLITNFIDDMGFIEDPKDLYWHFAVPINNQGEPLTASEVGL